MLTFVEALQIANESVGKVSQVDQDKLTSAHGGQYVKLEDCGITTSLHIGLLIEVIGSRVQQRGYTIDRSGLIELNPNSEISRLAHVISAYSLPGDDPYEEPAGDSILS